MRDDLASVVHPVISYGLRLKERLERGESPDFYNEQQALKGLLLSELEARRLPDFGGEGPDPALLARTSAPRRAHDQFLGVRYALVCWLDEMFILDSPWGQTWTERKIEEAVYGTNDRAWLFWEQAHLAEARPGTDALEAFYLCVMLGFRGELRDQPDQLRAWADATGKRIARDQGREWAVPPELDPPCHVPPLRGQERLQRMVISVAIFVLLLVPVLAVFLGNRFFSQ